jgi:hypothetical protein
MPRRISWFLIGVIALLATRAGAQFTAPPRGLNTLTGRTLSFGYLNALRSATGTAEQKMAKLNYDGVDVVLLAFASLGADGSLSMGGNAATFRSALLTNAHQRSKSVLFSVTGAFETVAASATLRQNLANSVLAMLEQYGFDGVDFDWEWPNNEQQRAHFTAMMQTVHAAVKARNSNYIICFVQGPGYWLGGTDWAAVSQFSDFCFMICYDWKNPANGPITKPGSVQWLGLGGTIEASGRGAVDYAVANGYPRGRIILGMPFYGSDVVSWFNAAPAWEADRAGFLAAMDPDAREVLINGGWHTSPDCVKRKMDALLDPRTSVFGGAVVRGVGFWEFGHEDTDNPQLTAAIAEWKNGNRAVTGPAEAPLPGTPPLIARGPGWRYFDSTTTTPPATWKDRTFNDASWRQGASPLGFGDGDEETVVDPVTSRITTYFRRSFSVANPAAISALTLRLVRDDGAVVYLNGMEVFRTNLPIGVITSTTLADTAVGTGSEESYEAQVVELPPALLVSGTNVLAVEIHQAGINSSDITMDAELLASARVEPVLVPSRAWWRFSDAASAPAANWNTTTFSDSAWAAGRGRLGYGNDGEWTPLTYGSDSANKPVAAWFRHTFQWVSPIGFGSLRVRLQRDDAAAVYLNGTELFRDNLPEGPLTGTTRALVSQGGAEEHTWRTFLVPANALRPGRNVLAVQTHQHAPDSSDLGMDLELTGIVFPTLEAQRAAAQVILTVPAAFSNWLLESSLLPGESWSPVTTPPVVSGGMRRYTLPASAPRQFFRMRRMGD